MKLLLCALSCFAAFAGHAATAEGGSSRAQILWTKTICAEKDRYLGWPTVCRLKSGVLLAVFSGDRDEHVCPWGKVQLVRSTDDGATWSAPQTIANGPLDDRDAGIVQLPDGEVIVTWFTSLCWANDYNLKRHPEWRRHLSKISPQTLKDAAGDFLIRSRDDGKSWSAPEKLSVYAQSPHGPIVLKDGGLLQIGRVTEDNANAASANCGTRTLIQVSRSDDAGRTWCLLCPEIPVAANEKSRHWAFHEPHVCELADGTLVGMVRYHGADDALSKPDHGYMRQSFSKDGGRTWSTMEKTPLLGLPPHLLALPNGKVLCVYVRRVNPTGFGEFACVSDDGGKTWDVKREICLNPSFCDDLGYPASCLLANGDILTVYYQKPSPKEKPVVMATRWKLVE